MKEAIFLLIFFSSALTFSFASTIIRGDPVAFSTFLPEKLELYQSQKENGYNWTEEWFEQMPIDHFSFTDARRFRLRYLINLDSYKPGGPIFFYTGNEGSIEGFAENTGFMWDIAPKFGAAVIFAEHRFYGKTQPFGNDSYKEVKNLGYLSSEQALADFVELIVWLKNDRIKNATKSAVIAFGGSYGGNLAAWIRTKYPHIVDGAIAGSAPVFWFQNANITQDIFAKIVTRTFKTSGCNAKTIVAAFNAIDELSKSDQGRNYLNQVFVLDKKSQIEKIEDAKFLKDFISETMKSMAMIDYPYPANFLTPLPGWPVKEACRPLNRNPSKSQRKNVWLLSHMVSLYYNYTGTTKTICANPEKCEGPYAQLGDPLGWPWQSCTEMVMPQCDSGLPNDFFPKTCPFTIEEFLNDCGKQFNSRGYHPGLIRPNWIIHNYGDHFPSASNIVFSNGKLDPWSGGGWKDSNTREGSLVSIILEQGAHHYDLRGAHKDDTDEVKKVREQEANEIKNWIKQAKEKYSKL
uniref:Uncharacterized protein n=1 Tax=Panagrolaimus sp. PS1159 TaxID=55785 RepID=A0AC35GYF3_9BILA